MSPHLLASKREETARQTATPVSSDARRGSDVSAKLIAVESSSNFVDGILLREDSDGNLVARLQSLTTLGNNGDGLELDENSAGDLDVVVKKATSSNNVLAGVRAEQASPGTGALRLAAFAAAGNGAGPGCSQCRRDRHTDALRRIEAYAQGGPTG